MMFLISVLLVLLANYSLFTAILFSFMNVIGATFPPTESLLDPHSPFILASITLGGLANIAFTITFTTIFYQILTSFDLRYAFVRQRLRGLSDHVVITPINGMGLELAKRLKANKIPFVFIDESMANVRKALKKGMMALHGDPTTQAALNEARIDNAMVLYALYDDDIKNTFVTIEARRGGKRVRVVSRIKRLEDIPKMEKSGARRTILPEAAVGIELSDFLIANS
jgi:voltage-gated potassium channel